MVWMILSLSASEAFWSSRRVRGEDSEDWLWVMVWGLKGSWLRSLEYMFVHGVMYRIIMY